MVKYNADFLYEILPSGSHLIRFSKLGEFYKFDDPEFNPRGISMERYRQENVQKYIKERNILTKSKLALISKVKKNLSIDKEFLDIIYKAKSDKRKFEFNKFGGNFSPIAYSKGEEKVFKKGVPGKKKITLDMAFQVGTFVGGDYEGGFTNIIKTVLMCQALNINLNIDVFDSDTHAINDENGYVIVNVANSSQKLDLKKILAPSHHEFFDFSLFNGYSASGKQRRIGTFLGTGLIKKDLGEKYDVIGGNLLKNENTEENNEMISQVLKIGSLGR